MGEISEPDPYFTERAVRTRQNTGYSPGTYFTERALRTCLLASFELGRNPRTQTNTFPDTLDSLGHKRM